MSPIDVWLEYQRIRVTLLNTPLQLTIKGEVQLLTAMRALAIDLDRKTLVT